MTETTMLIYISAAPDCGVERSVLGRAIADVPVDLGWRIVQSSGPNDPVDAQAILHADLHVLLLAEDIRAPIGVEWKLARNAGRRPRLFLRETSQRTPAARSFIRYAGADAAWTPYASPADLRRKALIAVADGLLDRAGQLALKPARIVALQQWREDLAEGKGMEAEAGDSSTGASSVMLSRDAIATSGGVLIGGEDGGA
jgi:hypothetical protein